jgi:hypothetical protein
MRALAICILMGLLSAGCGRESGPPMTLDWDLSASHTIDDVAWPDASLTAHEWRPASVRIRFSGNRMVDEDGTIRRLAGVREGNGVTDIRLYSHPLTAEDAYRLASRWCREWSLPADAIDRWHDEGDKTFLATAYNPKEKLGPNRPEPSVRILSSYLDDKPVVVSLQFAWVRAR